MQENLKTAMTSSFLEVARQGKNGWKRYLAGIAILVFVPITIFSILLLLFFLVAAIVSPVFRELISQKGFADQLLNIKFYGISINMFVALQALLVLYLFTLKLVMEKIHHRSLFTLFGSNTSSINWQKIVQSFGIWFGLDSLVVLIVYLIQPSRYTLSQSSSEWLATLPFSFLFSGSFALVVSLLFLSYLLQGIGLLIHKPVRLTVAYGLILSTLFLPLSSSPLRWVGSTICIMTIIWIILKDKRLELVIGFFMEGLFFSMSILTVENSKSLFPALLTRVSEPLPPLINFLLAVIKVALFYYIFFHTELKESSQPCE